MAGKQQPGVGLGKKSRAQLTAEARKKAGAYKEREVVHTFKNGITLEWCRDPEDRRRDAGFGGGCISGVWWKPRIEAGAWQILSVREGDIPLAIITLAEGSYYHFASCHAWKEPKDLDNFYGPNEHPIGRGVMYSNYNCFSEVDNVPRIIQDTPYFGIEFVDFTRRHGFREPPIAEFFEESGHKPNSRKKNSYNYGSGPQFVFEDAKVEEDYNAWYKAKKAVLAQVSPRELVTKWWTKLPKEEKFTIPGLRNRGYW